jgi:hypothetical protein
VDPGLIEFGADEIEIACERLRATPYPRAPDDPTGSRVRHVQASSDLR